MQNEFTDLRSQPEIRALMAKSAAISVRVADAVKAATEKAAADDSRSVASYVEKLLVAHLKAKGYLK